MIRSLRVEVVRSVSPSFGSFQDWVLPTRPSVLGWKESVVRHDAVEWTLRETYGGRYLTRITGPQGKCVGHF